MTFYCGLQFNITEVFTSDDKMSFVSTQKKFEKYRRFTVFV